MLLVRKLKLHIGPIILALALIVGTAAWQALYSREAGRWVSGSSAPGMVAGVIAASIILFELLLWPRKALRRFRLFQTKTWLAYHLWLGLACGPLAWIHAGYRLGGAFTTALMVLLILVLISGIYGWLMQILLPRWLLKHLPQETIASQIEDVSILSALEARQWMTMGLGPRPATADELVDLDPLANLYRGHTMRRGSGEGVAIVVGARHRRLDGRPRSLDGRSLLEGVQTAALVSEQERNELWKVYANTIEPFLLAGVRRVPRRGPRAGESKQPVSPGLLLNSQQRSTEWFSVLRASSSSNCRPLIDQLEAFVVQRQQFDEQQRAMRWLHGWVAIHAGMSVALGILLVAHIVLACKYW